MVFCHKFTWNSHGCTCVLQPEPRCLLPPHPIHQCHPSAPALSTLSHASNLDWWSVSHMIIHMFQCYSLRLSHPCLLPQVQKTVTSVSLLLSHIQGYHYHLSKFHIYALVYCIGVREKYKRQKRDKRGRDGALSQEGSFKKREVSKLQETLSLSSLWWALEAQRAT